jgi:iron(II)-dependent oxidoreductase
MADVLRPIIRGWVPAWPETTQEARQQKSQPEQAPQLAQVIQGKDGKEMRLVPAGWFEMGSTDAEIEAAYQLAKQFYASAEKSWFEGEKSRHRVWVDAFYMDTYEVTMQEYQAFRQATGHRELPSGVSQYAPGDQYPVVGVSWDDAEAYCRWADKALPTEAQWEKAARGPDSRTYPWGNEPVSGRRANSCDAKCEEGWKDQRQDDGYRYTAPVGSFAEGKSPYGIHDLAGNVWEWVRDWYDPQYYSRSPERNPENTTAAEYRVLRGGGWPARAALLRAALRRRRAPVDLSRAFGLRCVVGVSAPRK